MYQFSQLSGYYAGTTKTRMKCPPESGVRPQASPLSKVATHTKYKLRYDFQNYLASEDEHCKQISKKQNQDGCQLLISSSPSPITLTTSLPRLRCQVSFFFYDEVLRNHHHRCCNHRRSTVRSLPAIYIQKSPPLKHCNQ